MIPPTLYAQSCGVDIAYKVLGDGPRDIVMSPAFASHLDAFWELPENAEFLERLSGLGRLILFDKRGTGLSDRQLTGLSPEQRCEDLIAVMDAAGSAEAVLLGWLDAGAISLLTAALHPSRVHGVVAGEVLAAGHPDADHPFGTHRWMQRVLAQALKSGGWGRAMLVRLVAPDLASQPRQLAWWSRYESMAATPTAAARLLELNADLDLRPYLARIEAPVLLIHDEASRLVTTAGIQWLAERIPTSTLKLVRSPRPMVNALPLESVLLEIEEFLAGTRVGGTDRQLATLLVTDIVKSTEVLATGGNLGWSHLLAAHRDSVRQSLARFGGLEIDTAGDGFLASFALPSAALRCAAEVTAQANAIGIPVRAGLHTGEILLKVDERTGEVDSPSGDRRALPKAIGLAVHIAARVAAQAGPSEVLFTETVRSLLMGSPLSCEPTGEHALKGVPGRWPLHRLTNSAAAGADQANA